MLKESKHEIKADSETANSPLSSLSSSPVNQALLLVQSDDPELRLLAAKEIRRLTKTSQRCRRVLSGAVEPLVDMLSCDSAEFKEAALAALLNLAVKDEITEIVDADLFKSNLPRAGALKPIICFLHSENLTLQEHAAAAMITLSASSVNKPIISSSGAIPHLVETIREGGPQVRSDAIMVLYNLSTHQQNLSLILEEQPIPSLVEVLKTCKESSKTAEKCTALIESLVSFDEGRRALTCEEGGILAVVEVLESGLPQSREHAVGALLTMCESDRSKYREPILKEGAIPGLLELTVQGTPKSQSKAQILLRLLRENPYPRSNLEPDTLENIVCNIISQISEEDQSEKAKQMLAEMVQVSMEQSLRHLQRRASMVCTPLD
ncbi:U-box domain-containing protein 17-like [Primulina tabacum]|uniref:U-box domain-containing protein 17-like n=1 Tax=Primulina tabacum TaxID=48773 RepID=UPI003F5A4D67